VEARNRSNRTRLEENNFLAYAIGGCWRHAQAEDYPDFDEIFNRAKAESPWLTDEELEAECKAKGLKPPD